MSTKNDSDAVRKALSGFEIVKKAKRDTAQFLPPDGKTPKVKKLHKKYNSDSVEGSVLAKAKPRSDRSATKAVVVEPKDKRDAPAKRLTVLVKQGKIRAVQG
jgi:hypothetical protein